MKITDLRVTINERPSPLGDVTTGVLALSTDGGVEGYNFVSWPEPDVTDQLVSVVKPVLLGRDPLAIGSIWADIGQRRDLNPTVQGYVDVALWDIAGKVAQLPVHRLLGNVRTELPAYASSLTHQDPLTYVEEAAAYRDQGFTGYKIHPPTWLGPRGSVTSREIDTDIEIYRRVRDEVGADYALFADPYLGYTYSQALQVGRVLEELQYEWYEDPLDADDIYGYCRLRQQLSIPLLATERNSGGLSTVGPWLVERATDFLRGDVVLKGGITGLMKLAHTAEAFHLNCELHDAYNGLNRLAVLHVAMAIGNCKWYEVLVPHYPGVYDTADFSWGLAEPITVDSAGLVHAPTRPGLGVDVDWDLIRAGTIAELS